MKHYQRVLCSPWCSAAWCFAKLAVVGKNLKQMSHWTRFFSCRVWLAKTSGWLVRLWYHRPDSCCGNKHRQRHKHTAHQVTITFWAFLLNGLVLPGKTCCRGHSWKAWSQCVMSGVFPVGQRWRTPCHRWDTCETLSDGIPGCVGDAPPTWQSWDNTFDSHEAATNLNQGQNKRLYNLNSTTLEHKSEECQN